MLDVASARSEALRPEFPCKYQAASSLIRTDSGRQLPPRTQAEPASAAARCEQMATGRSVVGVAIIHTIAHRENVKCQRPFHPPGGAAGEAGPGFGEAPGGHLHLVELRPPVKQPGSRRQSLTFA